MKVLKQGTLPESQPPWPIGCEVVCPFCKCRFVPETYADFSIVAERHFGGRGDAQFVCPTCKRGVQISRPSLPLERQGASPILPLEIQEAS